MTKEIKELWDTIHEDVSKQVKEEPILGSFLHATILNHSNLKTSLSFHLSNKLENPTLPSMLVREVIEEAIDNDPMIIDSVTTDLKAFKDRDPACSSYSIPFLYYKGFHALQAYRISHWLWQKNRRSLALFLQHEISIAFGVDIHPAATIGKGILMDHGTGIVIGETSVIEDNVSIMQSVTLGGTGKDSGDRHPKVRHGVLLGTGAIVLGNIEIGAGAKVGAGSVVLSDVCKHTTVAGVPAREVGVPNCKEPALEMNHTIFTEKP